MKNDRIRLTLFQGLVRTLADTKMIQVLSKLITDNAIQENNRVSRLRRVYMRGFTPKFSFISTIRDPMVSGFTGELTVKGVGWFRCKQTGQVIKKTFIPAYFVPNDRTKEHKYTY